MSKREDKGAVSEDAAAPAEAEPGTPAPAPVPAAAPQGPGPDEQGAQQQTASLEQEIASLRDQVLRRAADYENFRKRMFREREDAVSYANQTLLLDLVPVIDDFERAVASAESSRDFTALHDGVQLIERQLVAMLEKKWGLVRFAAVGQPFDPNRHHAIAVEESADVESAAVIEEYQSGYTFRERVLRPATVKIVQPAPRAVPAESSTENKET